MSKTKQQAVNEYACEQWIRKQLAELPAAPADNAGVFWPPFSRLRDVRDRLASLLSVADAVLSEGKSRQTKRSA
jgi:hypothetical protein